MRYVYRGVAALTETRVKAIIQPDSSSVTPCPPHEFAAIHLVMLAHYFHPS